MGSPAYMAPEQVKNASVDPRTDIYALGATMYQALSGRFPFDAASMHALLWAITETAPAALDPSVDPRIGQVVMRALEKDPSRRFQSAAEMRSALEPWVSRGNNVPSAVAVSAPPPPTPMGVPPAAVIMPPMQTQPQRSSGGAGVVIAIVAMVFLLLCVGGGVAAYMLTRAHDVGPEPTASASASATNAASTPSASVASTGSAAKKPGGAPTTTATTTTTKPGVDAGTPPPVVVDAGGPKKQWAGTSPSISGGSFGKYDIDKTKAAVSMVMPQIHACYAATEFDPPDHQFTYWTLVVDPTGNVKNAHRKTDFEPHPKLDGCVVSALRLAKLQAIPGGGELDIGFSARTRDNP